MNWKFCQLSQGERPRIVDLSAHGQSPISGVELDRLMHVIANKKVRYRREPAIEILEPAFQDRGTRMDRTGSCRLRREGLIEFVGSVPCAQAGHPTKAAAPTAAPDKLFRNVRLESNERCPQPDFESAYIRPPVRRRREAKTGPAIFLKIHFRTRKWSTAIVKRCKPCQTANA